MSKPVLLAELPARRAYDVEGELPSEPEHHAECECEQCEACVPAALWREEQERRERFESMEREERGL